MANRLLFVWLYRLFLSMLAAIVQPETIFRLHRTGFLALEVAVSWRSAEGFN
jgi:hypothetical protein